MDNNRKFSEMTLGMRQNLNNLKKEEEEAVNEIIPVENNDNNYTNHGNQREKTKLSIIGKEREVTNFKDE
jgi:hypothetical protein